MYIKISNKEKVEKELNFIQGNSQRTINYKQIVEYLNYVINKYKENNMHRANVYVDIHATNDCMDTRGKLSTKFALKKIGNEWYVRIYRSRVSSEKVRVKLY